MAASVLCTLCTVLLLASCTQDEALTAPVNTTTDALALLPADTRVGIKAEITDDRGQSTTTRAEGDETAYYASNEIHPGKNVRFTMEVPGASDTDKVPLYSDGNIPFNTLATTEPFSTLRLKDFNLTEGDYRCVSRWTVLNADLNGYNDLYGWARLTANADGQPVLDYGAMKRAKAKVTIVVQDEGGRPVDVSAHKVIATLSLPKTYSDVIYTPEGETVGTHFINYLINVTTLAADEAINPEGIGIATYTNSMENKNYEFYDMLTADGNNRYNGEQNNTLAAIVPATATHTTTFTPIEGGPKFNGSEKLTITVNSDPDGDGPMTTGTYSLALKDIVLEGESGEGTEESSALTSQLSAFRPGEHYILTTTLRHNTLVSATAIIGEWSEVSASAEMDGSDGAKLPDNDNTNQ